MLKFIQSLMLIAGVCAVLCFGIFPGNLLAETTSIHSSHYSTPMALLSPPIAQQSVNLDDFLADIPSGFYAITDLDQLKRQLDNPQTVLIDVREPREYQAGHIPQAINIPLRSLSQQLDQIPTDQPVIVYCSSGYRAAMGVMTLKLLGYDNIQGFPPSFMGWKNAGEAIAKA